MEAIVRVEESFSENGKEKEGEYALVARLTGICGGDAVGSDEVGNSGQENSEDGDDDRKSALGILHAGLAEGADAVADSFDPRERGTTTGEDFQEEPVSDGSCDRPRRRKSSNGQGMAVAEDDSNEAADNHDQESADEEVSGNHEDDSGFADAAQIKNGDEQKNSYA
jgi:hypothetical protein